MCRKKNTIMKTTYNLEHEIDTQEELVKALNIECERKAEELSIFLFDLAEDWDDKIYAEYCLEMQSFKAMCSDLTDAREDLQNKINMQ